MRRPLFWFYLVLAVSVFLQFYQLGVRSLWEDEAQVAIKSFWPLLKILLFQKNVLFNLILSRWRCFGKSEFWLRTPSTLFALFSLMALFEVGKKLYSDRVSILATLLLTTSPFFLLESRQVKMYSLVLFLSLLSIYFLLLFFETGRTGSLLGHMGVSLMALLTHYMFVPFYLAQLAFVFLYLRKQNPLLFRRYLFALFGASLLFLLAYPNFLEHLEPLLRLYLHPKSFEVLSMPGGYLGKLCFVIYLFTLGPTIFPWNWGWVIFGGLLYLFVFFRSLKQLSSRSFKLNILVAGLPILLLSGLKNAQPHYSFISLPFYMLLLAAGISRLRPFLRNVCVAGIFLVHTYGLTNYFLGRQYLFIAYLEPYREVAQLVKTHFQPGDYLLNSQSNPSMRYYLWNVNGIKMLRLHSLDKKKVIHLKSWEEFKQKLPPTVKRVWFVERPPGQFIESETPIPDAEKIYRENVAFRARLDREFKRVGRWMYLKDGDVAKKRKFLRKFYAEERIVVSLYDLSGSL